MKALAVDTVLQRARGETPSRGRSLLVAALAALAAGVGVYRLLRNGDIAGPDA